MRYLEPSGSKYYLNLNHSRELPLLSPFLIKNASDQTQGK